MIKKFDEGSAEKTGFLDCFCSKTLSCLDPFVQGLCNQMNRKAMRYAELHATDVMSVGSLDKVLTSVGTLTQPQSIFLLVM